MAYTVEYQDNSTLGGDDFAASLAAYLNAKAEAGAAFVGVLPNGGAAGHFIFVDTQQPASSAPSK
jgi:hypothetical protein